MLRRESISLYPTLLVEPSVFTRVIYSSIIAIAVVDVLIYPCFGRIRFSEKPKKRIQGFEGHSGHYQRQDKMEYDQYKQECGTCDTVLAEDVHIECLEKKDGEEMTVCRTCWDDFKKELKEEGWVRNTEEYEPSDDEE